MNKTGVMKQILVLAFCAVFALSFIGCTATPSTSTNGTGTSSGTTSTTSTNGGNILTQNPPNTTTPNSPNGTVAGLDGNAAAGATKEDVQKNFNISMSDGAGKTEGDLQIAAGTWEISEISQVNQILGNLPESFRNATTTLTKAGNIQDSSMVIGGLHYPTNNEIFISGQSGDLPGTLVHEMTHAWQNKHTDVMENWKSQFWNGNSPKTSSVTDYGNTNAYEDMAESVRSYYMNGSSLKTADPGRYEFIKQNIMGGKEY